MLSVPTSYLGGLKSVQCLHEQRTTSSDGHRILMGRGEGGTPRAGRGGTGWPRENNGIVGDFYMIFQALLYFLR